MYQFRGRLKATGLEPVDRPQPRELVQVQADEIHVKTQAGVLWMVMALMVSTRRDRELITRLVALVAVCAKWGPLLFVTDGLSTYIDVVRKALLARKSPGTPRACCDRIRRAVI